MSPASRPRVSGCRASWSRPCRCRQAPVHAGPLQLRRKSTGHQDPGPAASRSGPSAFAAEDAAPRKHSGSAQLNDISTASGRSSTGRAPVSKTGGWGFDSLRPCESWKVPRAPDPRPGREAREQRGTGLTVTWPWGHLSRLRPQRWGVRANSTVDSIRQEPDPRCGSGFLSPQRPTAETSGMPALRHMRRLGNWLARLAVDQVPLRACRFESCPAYNVVRGGTSRWPATAAVSKTEGPHGRASSILAPSADGRRRRGGPAPGCYPGRGRGHEVRLLHLPPRSVGPARSGRPPVEREITGSSPVRSAAPWWLLAAYPDFHSGPRGFDPRPRHTTRAPMV